MPATIALAEREGFEPSKGVNPYTRSRRARSTTPAPLRARSRSLLAWQQISMQTWHMSDAKDNLFAELVGEVAPIKRSDRIIMPTTPPRARARFSSADVNNALDESLATPDFSEIDTGDTLSWHKPGVQKTVLRKLRRGNYAVQDELDLHGLNQPQAKQTVAAFLLHALDHDFSCVRIVHGKGNRSEYGPVLKRAIGGWLVKRKEVVAFASTPSHDGGTGAIYVLLSRRK